MCRKSEKVLLNLSYLLRARMSKGYLNMLKFENTYS